MRVESQNLSFILKIPGPSDTADLARRERCFYRHVAPALPADLTPNCIAQNDAGSSGWLLIEDLSDTHTLVEGHFPSEQQSHRFVEALAALHGSTLQNQGVLDAWAEVEPGLRIGTLEDRLSLFGENLRLFLGALRGSLDQKTTSYLEGALPFSELLQSEHLPSEAMVHGDAHYGNALFSSSGACLIDWGMPMRAFGEIDVAHAIAMNLPPAVRRKREPKLQRLYLEGLAAYGLPGSAELFRFRYRLGVLYAFASPISWWRTGVPEQIWRPALANLVEAADDLGIDK